MHQHQRIGYGHWKIYLPIYIKSGHISLYPLTSPDELQTLPDMLQTPPDTIRYGPDRPDTTRYHHTCIMYDLYGLKHHTVEISGDVTDPDGQPTSKYRATQLLICEPLSFAIRRLVSLFAQFCAGVAGSTMPHYCCVATALPNQTASSQELLLLIW